MSSLSEVIDRFKSLQVSSKSDGDSTIHLACTVSAPASLAEIGAAWRGAAPPAELLELWRSCGEARLFEDVEYGQWGLMLLSPSASAARTRLEEIERSEDFRPDDVIIGEFLGDQDLLVLAPSEDGDRRVLVALPLDSRADWFAVGNSIADFLKKYLMHPEEKFWERYA